MTNFGSKQDAIQPHVVIVGGGLAGMSAAEALAQAAGNRVKITLLESKRKTGGRAGSFSDPITGDPIDYCQHVAMGCCTNLIGLLRRFDMLGDWHRYDRLIFHHPNHPPSSFAPTSWLPAPLHLASAIGRLNHLSRRQKREVRSGFWRLMRTPTSSLADETAKTWLQSIGQSDATIEAFWNIILVSALGEETEVVSMQAARKVLIDGFAAAKGASDMLVPSKPLSEIFGVQLPSKLSELNVAIRSQTSVKRIRREPEGGALVELSSGEIMKADHLICAVPWHGLGGLFDPDESENVIDQIHQLDVIAASPITGIHLWFDRFLFEQPHAVMVETTTQWIFQQPIQGDSANATNTSSREDKTTGHYHQVVVSASRETMRMPKEVVLQQVVEELRAEFPQAREANLLRHRFVTDPQSVFSVSPEVQSIRRLVRPALPCIHLAGDWTDTGWPATMESAVISGRKAAQSVWGQVARPSEQSRKISVDPDLPRQALARFLIRR